MSYRNFPGAKWWKFDFHAHTPASDDFEEHYPSNSKGKVTPESWLIRFMQEGIDCVAITDHNCGDWIGELQETLEQMQDSQHQDYKPLVLFPGVEITAFGGVHILAIFGPEKTQQDIDALLGDVQYDGTRGKSDGVTNKTIPDVVNIITRRGGIAIPAHVDLPNGLFTKLSGNDLRSVLNNSNLYAMEVIDDSYEPPQLYTEQKLRWSRVKGSDTHFKVDDRFGSFTWVKMDNPSMEGLRLALTDDSASVSCNPDIDPNRHAEWIIEKLTVTNAKYVGRPHSVEFEFSPFLNAVIGGRGTGKSTLLEFMRLNLQRQDDIPQRLLEENKKYYDTQDSEGLLLTSSQISLICRKGTMKYRLNWEAKTKTSTIEEFRDGIWTQAPGEIRSLFPVHIYSQKQIFELAGEPSALLDIIDEAPDVKKAEYDDIRRRLENHYRQTDARIQELNQILGEENRSKGELNDLKRQIEQIENSGHREALQTFRIRQQQHSDIKNLENDWKSLASQLDDASSKFSSPTIDESIYQNHPDMLSALISNNQKWETLQQELKSLSQDANTLLAEWQSQKTAANWMRDLSNDLNKLKEVNAALVEQDIDPDLYPELLKKHRTLENFLGEMDSHRSSRQELKAEKDKTFRKLTENRKRLTKRRQVFLAKVLKGNSSVSIRVILCGEGWDSIEKSLRRILHLNSGYRRDFDYLKQTYQESRETGIRLLKQKILKIRNGQELPKDARFTDRLRHLTPDSINNLELWIPADDLDITFGQRNQPIEQGSPGQKTAALLAFILSYGNDPLLLDQPEDDLDNELIYDLVVQQLKQIKTKRQVIAITHNANIVVNADAEMVLPLRIKKGQTIVHEPASLQRRQVRESICNVLEGGLQAFMLRYKRINLEQP
ncbi:MAG: ABC transporter [Gemmatimonadota bacterium]|nr:ABC transporter [Gemmatimonadota bacterium]